MDEQTGSSGRTAAQSTRQAVNQVRRVTFLVSVAGLALFVMGVIWWFRTSDILFRDGGILIPLPMEMNAAGVTMMIAGAVILACAVAVRAVAGRCKACQGRVSRPFPCGSGPMKISDKLRFCPYCGGSVD